MSDRATSKERFVGISGTRKYLYLYKYKYKYKKSPKKVGSWSPRSPEPEPREFYQSCSPQSERSCSPKSERSCSPKSERSCSPKRERTCSPKRRWSPIRERSPIGESRKRPKKDRGWSPRRPEQEHREFYQEDDRKLDEDIARLKRMVSQHVKENFLKHFTGTTTQLTRNLVTLIKDGYEAYNGTLEGISLTEDHKAFIRSQVERHFDQIPVINEQLGKIEESTKRLQKKFEEEIDINHIGPGGSWLHLSLSVIKELNKQAMEMQEEMQQLLESLDGVNLHVDQQGNVDLLST